ncbi:hypothetical protein N657DRAFT_641354 [Parathielavia appendiculata]|uniref:Translation initiation factor IF-3 n=1 Tax=Parathielavia appendiculata TaxID=2587402 RepID=A0AAN6U998_9PEZI|nr:hypothetical protein N657DRAFT_641354 [Parathielavia appendiculata]
MRTSQCLFNSAVALRNVFVRNAAVSEAPWQLQRLLLPAIAVPIQPTSSTPLRRPFSTHHVAQFRNSRRGPASGNAAPVKDRGLRDYDIVYPWIQLRQEDGRLTEPQRTSQILKKLNLERNTLILLAAPRADASSNGPQYPICRIANRQAEEAAKSAQADKSAGKKKEKSKELEVNWAIAPHDLRTKMSQLKRFLSKGYQVTVTMMNLKKRDKRRASADEAKGALKVVEATIAEVPGAKEIKPREGSVGDTLTVHLQAPASSAAGPATESAGEATGQAPAAAES